MLTPADDALPIASLLARWRSLRAAHDHVAAVCARDLGMEMDQLPALRDLQAQMDLLAAEMVDAPASSDDDLLAKLELWRLLAEAEETAEDPAETFRVHLVLSVSAALARRRAKAA